MTDKPITLPEPAYPKGSECTIKEEAVEDFYTADQVRAAVLADRASNATAQGMVPEGWKIDRLSSPDMLRVTAPDEGYFIVCRDADKHKIGAFFFDLFEAMLAAAPAVEAVADEDDDYFLSVDCHYATPPRAGSETTASASIGPHDELSRDADGDIAIDWQTKDGDMLSMSLSKEGRLAWAIHAELGGCGTVQLNEACFRLLNKLLDEGEDASASVQGVMGAEVVAAETDWSNRYRVERGGLRYCVRAGTGTRALFFGSKGDCGRVARELLTAFRDGQYVATPAAPAGTGEKR